MLHALHYRLRGREAQVHFWANDLFAAEAFEAIWRRISGAEVLRTEPVGQSRFVRVGHRTVLRQESKVLGNSTPKRLSNIDAT